ncbi:undecaprenyl-phosphate glucose phosphotransferase [Halomonas getboli]|uniref:undecaprenyl-phosphate glucose phosphotransferase n=1 Tax=Halomonas getboli TaxID=2935862 RepID=UPI001FFEB27B|nr:undecaprenyl-phosphate glucose phosphotransferase [Halomonas getboli]MCK2183039.1 undecaprenyl-phosphate glucose phosphotransferase [Halomonas getboli]
MYTTELVRLVDLGLVILAGFFAFCLRFGEWEMPERYLWGITLGALLTLVVLPNFSIYRSWRGQVQVVLILKLLSGYLVVGGLLALIMFMTKTGANFSRLWVGYWMVSAASFSIFARALAYPLLNRLRADGANRKSVLLIGDAESCDRAIRHLSSVPSAGFDVAHLILTGDDPLPELLRDKHCERYEPGKVIEHAEQEVWICLPLSEGKLVRQIQRSLSFSTGNVRFMPDMRDFRLINHDVSDVAGLFLLDLSCSPMSFSARLVKWLEDKFLALAILVIVSPVLLFAAIGVKLTSPGPIFYRQERVGLNGRPFMMMKFRSMPVDSERDGVRWGGAKSKTTTRFGAFLRRTSLDELPQFFNVLKGDMSIVGPRPERTVFVETLKHEVPGYMQKHMVKAGITGWAQINGWRGDTDLQKRIECDLWYVENWSLWLDMKIMFLTFFKGIINKNAY